MGSPGPGFSPSLGHSPPQPPTVTMTAEPFATRPQGACQGADRWCGFLSFTPKTSLRLCTVFF